VFRTGWAKNKIEGLLLGLFHYVASDQELEMKPHPVAKKLG